MFPFLKKNPLKELTTQRARLLEEAMRIQRSGDLRLYAEKMVAIDNLEKQIDELHNRQH